MAWFPMYPLQEPGGSTPQRPPSGSFAEAVGEEELSSAEVSHEEPQQVAEEVWGGRSVLFTRSWADVLETRKAPGKIHPHGCGVHPIGVCTGWLRCRGLTSENTSVLSRPSFLSHLSTSHFISWMVCGANMGFLFGGVWLDYHFISAF